jgi:hypothetical protein
MNPSGSRTLWPDPLRFIEVRRVRKLGPSLTLEKGEP